MGDLTVKLEGEELKQYLMVRFGKTDAEAQAIVDEHSQKDEVMAGFEPLSPELEPFGQ
jgi:hypothetical protein